MTTIWKWIVNSSADPRNTSLSVKGTLAVVLGVLVSISGIAGIALPSADLEAVVQLVVEAIEQTLILVGSLVAVVGAVRKLWRSWQGRNRSLDE